MGMAKEKKKRFKYIFVILILIVLLFGGYNYYLKNNKKKDIKEEKVVEKIKEQDEEIIEDIKEELPYEKIINDKGIFKDYYEKAYDKLQSMSLDEKINQIFLVRVPQYAGTNILKQYQFGGYLLFGRDVVSITKEDLINKIKGYQEVSNIPIIVAIDEEGGDISRIKDNPNLVSEPFLSPMELYNIGGLDLIENDLRRKNILLEELGVNLNLAPVLDIASSESFIYNRTLGQDVNITSLYAARVVQVSKISKVSYALKHFPGYGDNLDTHKGLSIDSRTLEELSN